jgi:ABC-type sugar transport system ATPase subunit
MRATASRSSTASARSSSMSWRARIVTHDQVEAMTMGHRVAVLRDGRLQQCAAPRVLYDHPVNVFVAGFIGCPP